ncbi:unnamed protein product [Orchesella dallaii]|uniref:Uncharacterized protein n=1 Tax=Orchesella dallaii TaxID=48710 RepID=A0ABP1RHR4_9HEXA
MQDCQIGVLKFKFYPKLTIIEDMSCPNYSEIFKTGRGLNGYNGVKELYDIRFYQRKKRESEAQGRKTCLIVMKAMEISDTKYQQKNRESEAQEKGTCLRMIKAQTTSDTEYSSQKLKICLVINQKGCRAHLRTKLNFSKLIEQPKTQSNE